MTECQTAFKNLAFNVYSGMPRVVFSLSNVTFHFFHRFTKKNKEKGSENVKTGVKTGVDTILIELCEWELNSV